MTSAASRQLQESPWRLAITMAWLASTGLILLMVFPWGDVTDHTHWGKVAWIPFFSGPVKAIDIVGNALLYVPFGLCGAARLVSHRQRRLIPVLAFGLSLGTEAIQLYSHWRFPSTTDLVCNLFGAMLGRYLWQSVVEHQLQEFTL